MLFFVDGDGDGDGDGSSGDGAPGGDGDGAPGGGDGDGDGAPGGDGDDDKETLTPEAGRKLRSENKNLRDRLKAAETKARELEDKELADSDKLKRDLGDSTKRVETLETENRSLRVRFAAIEVGIRPKAAAAAAALVDWDDVDAEDDKAVADALKSLKKEHEYLFEVDGGGDGKKATPDADGGKKSRSASEKDPSPGAGRLRQAYANKD